MIYNKSDIDKEYYYVQNLDDKNDAAILLSEIKNNLRLLVNHLYDNIDKYPKYKQNILLLKEKFEYIIFRENNIVSSNTSYTVNKGEEMVFCLRDKKNKELYDINLLMYVALHELSHVASPIYDNHGIYFKTIFFFIISEAIKLNLYKKIDFLNKPENYCGLTIDDSII